MKCFFCVVYHSAYPVSDDTLFQSIPRPTSFKNTFGMFGLSSFRRPDSRIVIMTSSYPDSVDALKLRLAQTLRTPGINHLIAIEQLPYSGLPTYRFPGDKPDVMILCHSIENRRFAITDVQDSLYEEFLQYGKATVGKDT